MHPTRTAAAAALLAVVPAFASASAFTVDFEHPWNYLDGAIDNYYGGGTASDGSSGPNLGITFAGVSGLSNDASFTYYSGAPSMQGVAYAYAETDASRSFMNVAAGATGALSFFYASQASISGAVRAYSGLGATGTLLGSFDLSGNNADGYSQWTFATFNFNGIARSFDFSGSANGPVAFDNVSGNALAAPVPEPSTVALMLAGAVAVAGVARRRRRG